MLVDPRARALQALIRWSGINHESWWGACLRAPFRLIPRRLVMPVWSGPLKGWKWRVGAGMPGCWLGTYELDKQQAMAPWVKSGMTVCDIGAHAGFYSLWFAKLVGPEGRVFAFEPLPDNARYLADHLALNRAAHVSLTQTAVSDKAGTVEFAVGPTTYRGAVAREGAGGIRVPTVSLDQWLAGQPDVVPDVIKMDVEGEEVNVLKGAPQLLARRNTVWFIELHGREQEEGCAALLKQAGYTVQTLDGRPLGEDGHVGDHLRAVPIRR